MGSVSLEEETRELALLSLPATCGRREKVTIGKPGRELSSGAELAGALTLDSQPPDTLEINGCCLTHPVCGVWLWRPLPTNTVPVGLFLLCYIKKDWSVYTLNGSFSHAGIFIMYLEI